MIIVYKLTRAELCGLQKHILPIKPSRQFVLTIGVSIAIMLAGTALFTLSMNRGVQGWPLVFASAILIIYVMYVARRMRRVRQRLFEDVYLKTLCEDCELTIGSEGISESRPSSLQKLTWLDITRIVRSENSVIVHSSDYVVSVVPSRGFTNRSELDSFVEMLRSKTGVNVEYC